MNAMENTPLVSVIMAVHNGESFVEMAIQSVLNQIHSNCELLVINDGSIDRTEAVVLRYSFLDSRIRYFKHDRRGVAASRNVGLREMRGDFFCFLDADDALPPQSLSIRMEKFMSDAELSFCDGTVIICDEAMRPLKRWRPAKRGHVFQRLLAIDSSCFFGPSWLIRRDRSRDYVLKEGMTHAEDLLFFIGISRSGMYDFVDEEVLHYRKWPQSAMSNLRGLAQGYTSLYEEVVSSYGKEMGVFRRFILGLKIRKIMLLSFLANGDHRAALEFFLLGKLT